MIDPERTCRHAVDENMTEHFVDERGRPLCGTTAEMAVRRHGARVCTDCVRVRLRSTEIAA